MKKTLLFLTLLVCSFPIAGQTGLKPAVGVSTLPIRRVILYSNGIAYIERRGTVTDNAAIDLNFKQSQVDDVLKSMVVLDLGKGSIGSVSYNSSLPASARTAEIPFAIESRSSGGGLAEVLQQLQGSRVAVVSTKGTFSGAILTVDKRDVPADKERPATVAYQLVLASENGDISAFDLSDIRSLRLVDETTRRNINEFSNATASARMRDAKTITISSVGTGTREIVVSYTIAAPIWKTTYRVVLGEDGKPFFQGWAIIDNTGDESWENVQLSLVSGAPVSFIQNLQRPLYRDRPIIPIADGLNLTPQIYDPEAGVGGGSGSGNGNGDGYGSGIGSGSGSALQTAVTTGIVGDVNANFMMSSALVGTSVSDALVNQDGGVETAATGAEVGDLFEYKIDRPISVPRNRSALVPIVQTTMEGERVSIFRAPGGSSADSDDDDDDEDEQTASVKANPRAMSGLLLKNVTPMTFEGGPMTILDRDTYAGEGLMERLKPKEQRLISFAADLGTLIRIEEGGGREPAKVVKVVDGMLQVHYFKTDKRTYKLANQTDRPKVVYIEHPVRKNWTLSESFAKPDYTTARFYRFRVELAPFASHEVTVGENLGMMDSYGLSTFSPKDLDIFVTGRYIDDSTRLRLGKLIDLRMRINDIDAKIAALDKESEAISTDQQRFRSNIEALAKTPDAKGLIARYIAKAGEQESRLEQIAAERRTLEAEKVKIERDLATEIKNFQIN